MGQKDYLIAFTLIFIFSFALITFAVNFGDDNDATVNIGDDDALTNYNSTARAKFVTYQTDVNSSLESFKDMTDDLSEDPDAEITTTGVSSTIGVSKNVFGATKDALFLAYRSIFGSGGGFSIIFYTIIAIIGAIMILLWWKTIKGGNPE